MTLILGLRTRIAAISKTQLVFFSRPELLIKANIHQKYGINLSCYTLLFLF